MGIYVVTGTASGIGMATKEMLEGQGHEVITLDMRDADINCDLSDTEQCKEAVAAILARAPDGLDGFVPCAGVGPDMPNKALIPAINYFAVVDMVEALLPAVEKKSGAIVLISSNSAQIMPYDESYMQAMLAGDRAQACAKAEGLEGQGGYGGGKQALARWMRQNVQRMAKSSVRINAIAPGYTQTGMTEAGLNDPQYRQHIEQFVDSIPMGRKGQPEDQANAIGFLLSERASFISGTVLFVDGGHDALFRPQTF